MWYVTSLIARVHYNTVYTFTIGCKSSTTSGQSDDNVTGQDKKSSRETDSFVLSIHVSTSSKKFFISSSSVSDGMERT